MLLMTIHKEDDIKVEPYFDCSDEEQIIPGTEFLQNLHLKDYAS